MIEIDPKMILQRWIGPKSEAKSCLESQNWYYVHRKGRRKAYLAPCIKIRIWTGLDGCAGELCDGGKIGGSITTQRKADVENCIRKGAK